MQKKNDVCSKNLIFKSRKTTSLMNNSINHPTISNDEVLRPTRVEVDLKILADNFNQIKKNVAPAKIMPILKANAYGHGLVRVAQLMQELKSDCLGVAVLKEGI